ncbi:MAG: hypothetical protein V3S03_05635, partial [Vicinamibacteria bacterium]
MTLSGPRRRRGRILFSILGLLFAIGVVPLLWTSYKLVTGSRESLNLTQRQMQLDKARSLSSQVELYVSSLEDHVSAIARTLEIDAERMPFSQLVERIREQEAFERYPQNDERLIYVAVVDSGGEASHGAGLELSDVPI